MSERLYNAEWALSSQLEVVARQFDEMDDAYLRERKGDLEQVVERMLRHMKGEAHGVPVPTKRMAMRQQDLQLDDQDVPLVLVAHTGLALKTAGELVTLAKKKPLLYGSAGNGTFSHLLMEMLKMSQGVQITHIPYRGMGPAVTDLISGHVQVLMASGPSLLPMVQAGRVRAIGITSLKPSAVAPELTPMATAVPGYEYSLWWGLLAPAGTPAATLQQLNAAVNQALAKPAIKQQFLTEGAEVQAASPAQFGQVIARDIERWKTLARQQHIVAD